MAGPRVLLENSGAVKRLRISRPGFDVTDPALTSNQLSFDSDWLRSDNLWMTGSVYFPTTTPISVNFGKTFSALPVVFFYGIFTNGDCQYFHEITSFTTSQITFYVTAGHTIRYWVLETTYG